MRSLQATWCLALLTGCMNAQQAQQGNTSSVLVDLGTDNSRAIAAYNNLDTSPCKGAKAIVTGFDDFGGNANVTRQGLEKLAEAPPETPPATTAEEPAAEKTAAEKPAVDENGRPVTPSTATASTTTPTTTPEEEEGATLRLTGAKPSFKLADSDGLSMQRTTIDGVDTCLVTGAVNPITPALFHRVAAESGATHVYNLGQRSGGGYVEEGGYNKTSTGTNYYESGGRESTINNTSSRVVQSDSASQQTDFTWNQGAIASATGIDAAKNPRGANDYVCNMTGYLMSRTQTDKVEYLPGLTLNKLNNVQSQGFLHVDSSSSPQDVAAKIRETMKADFKSGSGTATRSN